MDISLNGYYSPPFVISTHEHLAEYLHWLVTSAKEHKSTSYHWLERTSTPETGEEHCEHAQWVCFPLRCSHKLSRNFVTLYLCSPFENIPLALTLPSQAMFTCTLRLWLSFQIIHVVWSSEHPVTVPAGKNCEDTGYNFHSVYSMVGWPATQS